MVFKISEWELQSQSQSKHFSWSHIRLLFLTNIIIGCWDERSNFHRTLLKHVLKVTSYLTVPSLRISTQVWPIQLVSRNLAILIGRFLDERIGACICATQCKVLQVDDTSSSASSHNCFNVTERWWPWKLNRVLVSLIIVVLLILIH